MQNYPDGTGETCHHFLRFTVLARFLPVSQRHGHKEGEDCFKIIRNFKFESSVKFFQNFQNPSLPLYLRPQNILAAAGSL